MKKEFRMIEHGAEPEVHSSFKHVVEHMKEHHEGSHMHHSHHYGKHKEDHKMHHEHVTKMCHGGKA